MHSSSLHLHSLVKKTKVLLAGPIQQAMYWSLGQICVLSMLFGWTGWVGEINIKSSTPACLFLLYSFSDEFRVYNLHAPICLKNYLTLSVESKNLQEAPQSFWGRTFHRDCRVRSAEKREERQPFLQDEPRSGGGGGIACWRGSVHLNPRNTFLIHTKVKGINPSFLPGLTG